MPKTLLVLTGSPRLGGNSDLLAEAFIRGVEQSGAQTLRFDAGRARWSGCIACETCWSKGVPCSVPDDFSRLYPLLEQADALAIVSPLYWFGLPGQIKSALDKLYAYGPQRTLRQLKITESYLLMVAHDREPEVFEGAVGTYRHIAAYKGWRDRGMLLAPHVGAAGEIRDTDFLARAEALGSAF